MHCSKFYSKGIFDKAANDGQPQLSILNPCISQPNMVHVYGNHPRWRRFHYLAWLAMFTCTSAVHLSERNLVHNINGDLMTVGQFMSANSNNSDTSTYMGQHMNSSLAGLGHLNAPAHWKPSVTAMMVGVSKSMQWIFGWDTDWLSACFVTTEFEEHFGCECTAKEPKPKPLSVFMHAMSVMLKHPMEAIMFAYFSQVDIYLRTQFIDKAIKRTVTRQKFDQAVIVGSGFDTRSYRSSSGMTKIERIFETDLKEGHDLKMEILRKCGIKPLNGDGHVLYEPVNLLQKFPFDKLWQHKDFKSTGNTLILSEQVFSYLDIYTNMNWLGTLAQAVEKSNGTATLILLALAGPNLDSIVAPRCVNFEECFKSQMPMMKVKSDAFMLALGWKRLKGYEDLENSYANIHMSVLDSGYIGIFTAGNHVSMSAL